MRKLGYAVDPHDPAARRARARAFVERSCSDVEWFWEHALADMDMPWHRPYDARCSTPSRGQRRGPTGSSAARPTSRPPASTATREGALAAKTALIAETEDGAVRALHASPSSRAEVGRLAQRAARARRRAGRPRRLLHADGGRGRVRDARHAEDRRGLHPDLLRLRAAGRARAAGGRRGEGAVHGRRRAAPRPARSAQDAGRPRASTASRACSTCVVVRRVGERRRRARCSAGRDRFYDELRRRRSADAARDACRCPRWRRR